MQLKAEDKQKYLDIINKKWLTKKCFICGENKFAVADIIFDLQENPTFNFMGVDLPVFVLVCGNCGHVMFFNTKILDKM